MTKTCEQARIGYGQSGIAFLKERPINRVQYCPDLTQCKLANTMIEINFEFIIHFKSHLAVNQPTPTA